MLRSRRLLVAACLGSLSSADITDLTACRAVAFRAARRGSSTLKDVLAVAEDMLLDEANYEIVASLLEDIQNLVSHRIEVFATPDQVEALLGPKSAICWNTLTTFWTSVATWCEQTGVAMEPGDQIRSAENEQLRAILWTSNRSLPTGEMVGLGQVVEYERAGQPPLPGFSHIGTALDALG